MFAVAGKDSFDSENKFLRNHVTILLIVGIV